jgi:hypothetical protein
MQFPRTDAILVVSNHPHRREPLVKAYWGIFTDCSNFRGELFAARLAFPNPT